MAEIVRFTHHYSTPANDLFAHVVRYENLVEAMREQATYDGLPAGEAQVGQKFDMIVTWRGAEPAPPWTMEVVERDDVARVLRTLEHSAQVERWAHTITVDENPAGGSVMHDVIEIDAGSLTERFVKIANRVYPARHAARRKLLGIAQEDD